MLMPLDAFAFYVAAIFMLMIIDAAMPLSLSSDAFQAAAD